MRTTGGHSTPERDSYTASNLAAGLIAHAAAGQATISSSSSDEAIVPVYVEAVEVVDETVEAPPGVPYVYHIPPEDVMSDDESDEVIEEDGSHGGG